MIFDGGICFGHNTAMRFKDAYLYPNVTLWGHFLHLPYFGLHLSNATPKRPEPLGLARNSMDATVICLSVMGDS